jgi:ribosomal protein S18 acetylase RimI-like enzyme
MEIHLLSEPDVNATADVYLAHLSYAVSSVRDDYRNPNAVVDETRARKRYRDYLHRLVGAHDDAHPLMVAVMDKRVVGFAEGRLKQGTVPLQLPCDVPTGYLQLAHTLEPYRGRGIARNLEAHLLEYFATHGAQYAELDYFRGNDLGVKTWSALGYHVFYEDVRKRLSIQKVQEKRSEIVPGPLTTDLQLQAMKLDEIPQVVGLYTDMMGYYSGLEDPFLERSFERTVQLDIEITHLLENQSKDSKSRLLVAKIAGEIIGFLMAEIKECPVPSFMAAEKRIGSIGAVFVKPEFRGMGTASRMEHWVASDFRNAGISLVEHLRVFKVNTLEAGFWRSAGYRAFNYGARKALKVS